MNSEQIIQRLARHLPDELLKQIFPDTEPQHIRDLLLKQTSPLGQGQEKNQEITNAETTTVCKVFTDGASRGNPGLAGAGVVLLDNNGQELHTKAEYLGHCTNNVAEYRALILGLKTARELGCSRPNIFLDSELIVRQVSGRYKVKNATLKPLFATVQGLLKNFDSYSISHVPRAQNSRADELANQGIDRRDTT